MMSFLKKRTNYKIIELCTVYKTNKNKKERRKERIQEWIFGQKILPLGVFSHIHLEK